MGDPGGDAKAAKKAAKAQAKLQKKLAKKGRLDTRPAAADAPIAPGGPSDTGPSAAERAAAAAERQVALHRYRVWLSLLMALIALATFLITVKPWRLLNTPEPPSDPAPINDNRSP